MSVFRIRSVPGCSWPPLCDGALSQIWEAYRQLEATQWLAPAEIVAGQLVQARTLLEHCARHVPYYREMLTRVGIAPRDVHSMDDFRRLPLLPRRVYQQQADAFVAEALPPGTTATGAAHTSGSSGSPTRVLQTNLVNLWWCAFYLRDLDWCGFDPTGSIASIRSTGKRGQDLKPFLEGVCGPCWLAPLQGLIETGPAYLMDISQDARRQLHWLRHIAPNYLLSYPANLEVLAGLVRREGPIPSLRAIQVISDTLTPETRGIIEAAFGVPVKNSYSCAEAGYLASSCPSGQGLHVHAENVLFEVLNEQNEPCAPGETGRVIITTLTNFRAPFIRYELGDLVTLADKTCACGRGLPLLSHVQGKNSPMFRLRDGRCKSSTRLALQIRKVGGHWQHQVVQKSLDRVVVRLVRDPSWTQQHALKMIEQVREFFEGPVGVELELHDNLPTPPCGKFQNMIVDMP